jgi:hypothetical protein
MRFAGRRRAPPEPGGRRRGLSGPLIVEGAETSLERAAADGWTVVSIKNDWATVFADT